MAQQRVDLGIQLRDDRRAACRPAHRPRTRCRRRCLHARRLGERRHVGRDRRALQCRRRRACRACRPARAAARRAPAGTSTPICPPSRSVTRRPGAAIRHVRQLDAGLVLEELHREVMRRAVAGRAVVDLARARLRAARSNSAAVFAFSDGCVDQREAGDRERRDRREILDRVVRDLLEEAAVQHDRVRRHQQRVAVGRRLRRGLGADVAARADAVVDDDRRPSSRSPIFCPSVRARMSMPVPGENGTMMRIGRPARRIGLLRAREIGEAGADQRPCGAGCGDEASTR